MNSLLDLKVLITRPVHQANELATQIQYYGGKPLNFPTIEIVAKPIKPLLSTLKTLKDYDFIVFISPNAVFKTAEYIHRVWPCWPSNSKIVATGPGSVLALKQCNIIADYYPDKDFNATGILALPILQNLKQKNILIIKGQGGRLNLAKGLKYRGAHVKNLNVYKRQIPNPSKNNIPDKEAVDAIICTSNSGLKNLTSLLYPSWQGSLFKKYLLVVSPRIADTAKKLGFVKPPLISDNASNAAILQTLISWREQALWNLILQPPLQKK